MSGKFELVRVDDLITHHTSGTQRVEGVHAGRVAAMVADWDLAKVGTITVSRRPDGSLFVPDGAHRATAAREVGLELIPAIVHDGLTQQEEAALFVGLNTFARVSPISRFMARVDQGDEVAVHIKSIIEARGWRIRQGSNPGDISAIAAVERAYRTASGTLKDGTHPEALEWALDVITGAWGHDREGAHEAIIQGLAQMYGRFGSAVDAKALAAKLAQTRPLTVVGHAKVLHSATGGLLAAHIAKVIAGIYNAKRRTNLLPEWVWTR